MHILITANAAWNVLNFRRPIVKALIADGHSVTVLAPRDYTVEALEHLGCRFLELEISVKGLNPVEDMNLVRRMRKIFRAERPDAILSYTIKNNIFGALATRGLAIPFIPNVTGLGTAFLSDGLLQRIAEGLYRIAFRHLDIVFFQNADDRDLFLERRLIKAKQTQLLPGSGIDLDHFVATVYPAEDDAPIFLMIARLLRDKGVYEFVAAADKVKSEHPQARFQLLGAVDAANRTAIEAATVASWEAKGTIEYLGTIDDVRPHIAAARCVVLPSYREGAPRTLIEAAAMARPLITTDVPGCRAVVDHEETGLMCAPRSAESLADTLHAFLSLPDEAQQAMGLAGRKKMEQEFDQQIVVDAYREAINDVIRTKAAYPTI